MNLCSPCVRCHAPLRWKASFKYSCILQSFSFNVADINMFWGLTWEIRAFLCPFSWRESTFMCRIPCGASFKAMPSVLHAWCMLRKTTSMSNMRLTSSRILFTVSPFCRGRKKKRIIKHSLPLSHVCLCDMLFSQSDCLSLWLIAEDKVSLTSWTDSWN